MGQRGLAIRGDLAVVRDAFLLEREEERDVGGPRSRFLGIRMAAPTGVESRAPGCEPDRLVTQTGAGTPPVGLLVSLAPVYPS